MSEDSELDSDQQKQLIKELKQRMIDDGEYIYTLAERCQRYYEHILKHKAENRHLVDKIQQLYEGVEEQKQRINHLEGELERTKQERNAIAKNTREPLLLKLDEANDRIKSLIEERDRANRLADWKWNLRGEFESLLGTDKIEEGIEAVKELKRRIQRLEEAGQRVDDAAYSIQDWSGTVLGDALDELNKAKEAKP